MSQVAQEMEPQNNDLRAVEVLRAVMGIASEIALELDVAWSEARDLFASTLFARAETRYRTAPRIAAALETSLRTVKQHRHRRRLRNSDPKSPDFNTRRRVLSLLEAGHATLAELERAVPPASDVNYARCAVESLQEDGLIDRGPQGRLQPPAEPFVPWYRRPGGLPAEALQEFCDQVAELVATRVTARPAHGADPATLATQSHRIAASEVDAYRQDLAATLEAFGARWRAREVASAGAEEAKTMSVAAAYGAADPGGDTGARPRSIA